MSELAIYEGQRLLGHVGTTARGLWEARDADDALIGVFPTRQDAERAVAAAARQKATGE